MSIPVQVSFSIEQILSIMRQLPDEVKLLLIKEWLKEFSEKKEGNTTPTSNLDRYNEPLDLDKYASSIKPLKGSEDIWQDELPIEELLQLLKPTRKKTDIEQLKKEQNYRPIDKDDFLKKINELNIEEPLEDLLKMI